MLSYFGQLMSPGINVEKNDEAQCSFKIVLIKKRGQGWNHQISIKLRNQTIYIFINMKMKNTLLHDYYQNI